MELTRPEMAKAALVFERSLVFLHKLLPHTPVLVAYLPSPLSSYQLLTRDVSIQRYVTAGTTRYPKERVTEYSNAVCLLIRSATIAQGAGFLDLRPAIRAASNTLWCDKPPVSWCEPQRTLWCRGWRLSFVGKPKLASLIWSV